MFAIFVIYLVGKALWVQSEIGREFQHGFEYFKLPFLLHSLATKILSNQLLYYCAVTQLPTILSLSTKFALYNEHPEEISWPGSRTCNSPQEAKRDEAPTKIHQEQFFIQQGNITRVIQHNHFGDWTWIFKLGSTMILLICSFWLATYSRSWGKQGASRTYEDFGALQFL